MGEPWRGIEAEAEECSDALHGPAADPEEPTLRHYLRRAMAHGVRHGMKLCTENANAMGLVGVRALGPPVHQVSDVADAIERGEVEP